MRKNTLNNAKVSKKNKATNVDKLFDEGQEDILKHFDTENPIKRVLVDFPQWMLDHLDKEARHLGLTRQAIIKTWLNDRINLNMKKTS